MVDHCRNCHNRKPRASKLFVVFAVFFGSTFSSPSQPSVDCTDKKVERLIDGLSDDNIEAWCGSAPEGFAGKSKPESDESSRSSKSAPQEKDTSDREFKHNVMGLGSYALTQSYSTYTFNESYNYSGTNIFYQRNLNEHFAISVKRYSVSDSIDEIEGITGTLWLGSNFGRIGWNFAAGLGSYTEEWEIVSFSGAEVGLRLGYQWEDWHLYLAGFSRSTTEQEDTLRNVDDYTHTTWAFNLGYRF